MRKGRGPASLVRKPLWDVARRASAVGPALWSLLERLARIEPQERLSELSREVGVDARKAASLLRAVAALVRSFQAPEHPAPLKGLDYLSQDPEVCHGAVCLAGTRVMAFLVLGSLAADMTPQEIVESAPTVSIEGLRACARLAEALIREALGRVEREAAAARKAG